MTAQSSPETFDGKHYPVSQSMNGFAASTLTQASQALLPVTRQSTQAGSEIAKLASRRIAAWSEHQKRLMACRQPTDVAVAMQSFWTRAFDDYTTCNKALIAAWTTGFTSFASMAPQMAASAQRDILSIRDTVTEKGLAETDPRYVAARRDAA